MISTLQLPGKRVKVRMDESSEVVPEETTGGRPRGSSEPMDTSQDGQTAQMDMLPEEVRAAPR